MYSVMVGGQLLGRGGGEGVKRGSVGITSGNMTPPKRGKKRRKGGTRNARKSFRSDWLVKVDRF